MPDAAPAPSPSTDLDALAAAAEEIGFPLFVKAVAGGGGRGMRRVDDPNDLREVAARPACARPTAPSATRRSSSSRPWSARGTSRCRSSPTPTATVMHLYERDCSVQRRHQKVVEIAPAPNLDPALRDRMCADAVRFAQAIGYHNAGTVEFLLDPDGRLRLHRDEPAHPGRAHGDRGGHRRRPRRSRRCGSPPARPSPTSGLRQEDIRAPRRRPAVPDHDRGPGQRLPPRHRPDHDLPLPRRRRRPPRRRHAYTGAEVSPHFDSMLVKLTCRGRDFATAVRPRPARPGRVPDPRRLDQHPVPRRPCSTTPTSAPGGVTTVVHRGAPRAARPRASSADRGTKLLTYLADVTVNQPHGAGAGVSVDPVSKLPALDLDGPRAPTAPGSCCCELGPEEFARRLREQQPRRRHRHDVPRRPPVAARHPGAHPRPAAPSPATSPGRPRSCWSPRGVGRRDLRRRAALPARGPVGAARRRCARRCPTSASRCCCAAATPSATRRTRPRSPRPSCTRRPRPASTSSGSSTRSTTSSRCGPAIEAVRATGTAVAEVALCYTGDLLRPRREALHPRLLPPARRADRRRRRPHPGDQGHGRAAARPGRPHASSRALRERFDLPVHLHTHDTAGGQLATLLAAIDAGVDAVDAACAAMAGTTEPAGAVGPGRRDRPLRPRRPASTSTPSAPWSPTGRPPAASTRPSSPGCPPPPAASTRHEIPGGQLSNLRQQAIALGLGETFEQIEDMYAAANDILGNVVKVTPSSKVVGDLALHLVGVGADPAEFEENPAKFDIPDSVIGFLNGELGDPPGGWPEPFRTKALAGPHRRSPRGRARPPSRRQALVDRPPRAPSTSCSSPGRPGDFDESRETYGDLSVLGHPRLPLRPASTARSTRSSSRRASGCSSGSRRSASPTSAGCAP